MFSVNNAGFENFGHKNNLEQLLINYANESLQGDFNKQVCVVERIKNTTAIRRAPPLAVHESVVDRSRPRRWLLIPEEEPTPRCLYIACVSA